MSVAYVTLFGSWRFSVLLGSMTGLPMRGLAVNPRPTTLARFVVNARAPAAYVPKQPGSFSTEHDQVLDGNRLAFEHVLGQWSEEANSDYVEQLANELNAGILVAGEDEAARELAIEAFVRKLAVIEHGGAWEAELESVFDEDSGTPKTAG